MPTIVARNVSNPGTEPQIALCYQRHGCHLFWQPTLLLHFCGCRFRLRLRRKQRGCLWFPRDGRRRWCRWRCWTRHAGWLSRLLSCLFASRLCGRFHFGFGRGQGRMELQVRPSEFHQLLRKVTIEFLGCAGDCQWGGEGVVFGVRRLLRNDGSPDRIALNQETVSSSLRLRSNGISSANMGFLRCDCVAGFKRTWEWGSD